MRQQAHTHSTTQAVSFIASSRLIKIASSMVMTASVALTGCATTELLEHDTYTKTETHKKEHIKDQVVAFGKPASKLPNMPINSVVIVGEKYSYVMSEGGAQFVNLMSTLDRRYFNLERELAFTSAKNDGQFSGKINLSYAKIKDEFSRSDIQFFLQNKGQECTTKSDERINAQRFCFDIDVVGAVYPQVSNYSMVRSNYNALSQPYTVSFYTTTTSTRHHSGNIAQKLVLFPFALAFDVVTLPLQILEGQ